MRATRIFGIGMALACAAGARAQTAAEILNYKGPDREQKLLDGARKEGAVTIYSSLTINQMMRPMAEA